MEWYVTYTTVTMLGTRMRDTNDIWRQSNNMNNQSLSELANQYRPYGINHGGEFLFSPEKAILFLDDLARNNVMVIGCDLWKYVNKEKGWIVELLGAGFVVNELVTDINQAASLIKQFIKEKLPDDAEFVSLIFQDYSVMNLF